VSGIGDYWGNIALLLIDLVFGEEKSAPSRYRPLFRQLECYTLKSVFITTGSGWSSGPSTITLRPGFPGL